MAEYKLSYTAAEIDEKIGKVGQLSTDVSGLQNNTASLQSDVGNLQTDVQTKAEIVTLTTAEYKELETSGSTNANALYMLTDAEEDVEVSNFIQVSDTQPTDEEVEIWINTSEEYSSNEIVDGLTNAQINALDRMFKVAVYDDSKDVSGAYAAFKVAFGLNDTGGEEPDEPDTPVTKTYTITAELVNVASNNNVTSVTEGSTYTATLTASDGYELDSVSVIMGGVDITATAYANGVISIASVTGNVEIVASASVIEDNPAELITNGLVDYFDFRTAEYDNNGSGGKTTINSNIGNGWMFTWANNVVAEQSIEYGIKSSGRSFQYSNDSTTTQTGCGEAFTWVFKGRNIINGNPFMSNDYAVVSNVSSVKWRPKYNTESGTANIEATEIYYGNMIQENTYKCVTISVDGNIARLYFDEELVAENDGSTIDGFVSWYDKLNAQNISGANHGYLTQLAVYNRALAGTEVVETVEYLKTLEVSE